MPEDLYEKLELVENEETFLAFVKTFASEREASDNLPSSLDGFQGEWANNTIASFLEAAVAWAQDSDFGVRPGPKAPNQWRLFADFLMAGRSYE